MNANVFKLIEEITSAGDSPAIQHSELVLTKQDRIALATAKAEGFVIVTEWIEGEKLVEVTAKGLRAFGAFNGSDPADVEAAIKHYGLK